LFFSVFYWSDRTPISTVFLDKPICYWRFII
jgi:hypothetical protein